MGIPIYILLILTLWLVSKTRRKNIYLRYSRYTVFLVPAVNVLMDKIMKKDYTGAAGRLMFLYGPGKGEKLYVVHASVKLVSLLLFASFPIVYITIFSPGTIETVISLLIPVAGWALPDFDLTAKIKMKKQSVLMDYPAFCTDLAVMSGAGLEITKAWKAAAEKETRTILYTEARRVVMKASAGTMFGDALKDFSANMAIAEIHTFVTIINQEIKSGSGGMSEKLKECAKRSWKIREDIAKRKGEEALSKLVFPLALGLTGILLILAAPAVLIMKGVQ